MSTPKPCMADLALINGKIITVDEKFSIAEAVSVKDGKIQLVGTTEEVKKLTGPETKVIDLKGKTAMPGLYDSHIHIPGTGSALMMINCRTPPMYSIEDMKKAVAEKVKESKPGEWVIGRGWDQAKLAEQRNPSRWDLDEVSPDNPVILTRTCGHLLVANSKALEIAGITKDTPNPVGGQIVKNKDGEPTGMFEETAMGLVRKYVPEDGIPEFMAQIKAAYEALNKVGITSAIDPGTSEDQMVAYQLLKEQGLITVRTNMMLRAVQENEPIEKSVERVENFPMISGYGDDLLKLQGFKLFVDGGLGGRTALLREHYENDPDDFGLLTIPEEDLQKLVDAANKRGMLCGIHCCGGKAMDVVLEAYKKTDKIKPIKGRGFYLIHAYQPSEQNFKDCIEYGINIASQPDFLYYLGDSYINSVGLERCSRLKPHRDWLDHGIMTASGTDSPVTPYPPFPCLWASIARETEIGKVCLGEDQKVTREEAIRMYTINGAHISFEQDIKGSLEPGKLADIIILDRDILTCPEPDIKDTVVLETILGGETVYKK